MRVHALHSTQRASTRYESSNRSSARRSRAEAAYSLAWCLRPLTVGGARSLPDPYETALKPLSGNCGFIVSC